ncbi:MAG: GTPase [Candidatus Aenigmatarchaeota archaeon]
MLILQTETIPVIWILFFLVLSIVIMFLIKVFISDRLQRRILTKKPIVLLLGSPGAGKGELIKNLTGSKVKTKMYPFIGRFRISDGSFEGKNFRVFCFYSINKHETLKKENIRLLDKKPAIIIFVVRIFSDFNRIKKQEQVLKEIRTMFPDVPTIVAINKDNEIVKERINDITKIFGNDVIDISDIETKNVVGAHIQST